VLEKDKETGQCYTFDDFYIFKGLLGYGAFGIVVKALNRESGEECAVKVSRELNLDYQ
jgi:serine/threonine protein kinase